MLRFIKAETYKLFKSRIFIVLCVIALWIGLVSAGMSKLISSEDFIKSSLKGMTTQQQEQFIKQLQGISNNTKMVQGGSLGIHFNFKDMFNPKAREIFYGSFGSGVIEILLAVLIGALVAKEYSSGTIKNMLSYGKKREHYYLSKLIAISIGFIVILIIMVTVPTIFGVFMYGWGEAVNFNKIIHLFVVFGSACIVGISIISLLTLLATLVKSNGTTIGIGIVVFSFLPSLCGFLYGKYSWLDKIYELTTSYNWGITTSIRASNGDLLRAVTISLVTIAIAAACGIMIIKKQDIH